MSRIEPLPEEACICIMTRWCGVDRFERRWRRMRHYFAVMETQDAIKFLKVAFRIAA